MASSVPIVEYLVLDGPGEGGVPKMTAHLVANECAACGARYFDRRNACANPDCGGREFTKAPIATSGEVKAFTIVSHAAPGIPVPFVAALVDCEGTSVRGNLINVEPDPGHLSLGMKVRLATYVLGADSEGTEAVGFGFEPISN